MLAKNGSNKLAGRDGHDGVELMSRPLRVGLRLLAWFVLYFALAFVFVELKLGTSVREPSFVLLVEASANNPAWKTKGTVRWAGMLGGRTDLVLDGYGDKTALESASEAQSVLYLPEAMRYSSREHVEEVFAEACAAGRSAVVGAMQSALPGLECPAPEREAVSLDPVGEPPPE